MEDLNLETTNWEICMANLTDAINALIECGEDLEKALKNIDEARAE